MVQGPGIICELYKEQLQDQRHLNSLTLFKTGEASYLSLSFPSLGL
jgi:hypothetical protein